MKLRLPFKVSRKGAVLPRTAQLLVPLIGMLAFSLDIGWITVTRADLQTATDAAAAAAARQLVDGYVTYNLPNQTNKAQILADAETKAKTYAKQFASYNAAGGVQSLALNDSDITFGFMDSQGNYTPAPQFPGYPNPVNVQLRRDGKAN